jgi:hypothetical protein
LTLLELLGDAVIVDSWIRRLVLRSSTAQELRDPKFGKRLDERIEAVKRGEIKVIRKGSSGLVEGKNGTSW